MPHHPRECQSTLTEGIRVARFACNPAGQNNYARCLERGIGVDRNLSEAAKYYRLSASQEYAKGQRNYSRDLRNGIGLGVNLIEAAKYAGLCGGRRNEDFFIEPHLALAVDLIETAQYYKNKLSGGQHDAIAQNNYAYCREHGLGVAQKLRKAPKHYKLAADQNSAFGQNNYAFLLEHGSGVDRNVTEAARY
jgi:TPR repeat protein